MDLEGFHVHDGHVQAWGRLPNGTQAAFHFCPGDKPDLDAACESMQLAIGRAVELVVFECVPEVPEAPPMDAQRPCYICNTRDPLGVVRNAKPYCREHDPGA